MLSMNVTTTYEKMRTLLAEWERVKPLETALKGLSVVLGVNQEPRCIAEAVEIVAVRGREFDNTLAMCLVLALWASRPFNADGSAHMAALLDSLESEMMIASVVTLFPVSIRTSLPGFLPRASELVARLETLLNDRTTELSQQERLLALELIRFLRTRRHRYQ
jgi:hypothetical protein